MLDFVGVVARDLAAERPLHVFGWRRGGDSEQLVVGLQRFWFLNSATFDAGSSRCFRAASFFDDFETVLLEQ